MRNIAVIYLVMWPVFRSLWHLFNTDNYPILQKLYFISIASSIVGLFGILYYIAKYGVQGTKYVTVIQFRSLTFWLFIYSMWCFVSDLLMTMGVGDKNSWVYTGMSIALLIFPLLWIFALKPLLKYSAR